jgi:polysaccharide export outer membrane protein
MRRLVLAMIALALAPVVQAQTESLVVGPGDQLHIRVLEAPELEQVGRVNDAGTFPLTVGGEVKLVNETPAQAAATIGRALVDGHFFLHPHVTVVIEQMATQNVTVIGQVRVPGTYPIGTPRKVLDVLALAGGLTDFANRNLTIERKNSDQRVEYFVSNDSQAALNSEILVYPGDKIVVPKADVIYMLGDFYRPGGIVLSTNDSKLTMLQAATMAGGTPPTAVPSKAKLIRKQPDGSYVEIAVHLSAMAKGKQADFPLQPNDIVYVPFSYIRNAALGITGLVSAASSAAIYHY